MLRVKIQMQADLNLRWAHMSEGTSSYIAAEISWNWDPMETQKKTKNAQNIADSFYCWP